MEIDRTNKNPDEIIGVEDGEKIQTAKEWIEERYKVLVGGIWLDLIDMPEGASSLEIKDGKISIDKKKFEEEREKVKKALFDSIEKGDKVIFDRLTGGLAHAEDPEQIDLYIKLRKLFKKKDASNLNAINVDLIADGIAQRNIIREGLKPQIEMLPFSFRDRKGNLLDTERDLDIVFVKDKGSGYKLIIGSKKGIEEIEVPDELGPNKFQPDFTKIEKDPVTDAITFRVKPAKNGAESYVTTVEVRKGPIDIPQKLAKEEAEEQAKRTRKKKEEDSYYNPPPARTPRRSSESGGYGYTSVSG